MLDSLRQPLESGTITIHRASAIAHFPARFQLVLAANPCQCGLYGTPGAECTCPVSQRRRYLGRLSGPLLDRVDIHLGLRPVTAAQLRLGVEQPGWSSAEARSAVVAARAIAASRLSGTPWRINAQVSGAYLRSAGMLLPASVTAPLDRALERGSISMRGYDRTIRVAWTVADLAGLPRPGLEQVGQALYLRKGMS